MAEWYSPQQRGHARISREWTTQVGLATIASDYVKICKEKCVAREDSRRNTFLRRFGTAPWPRPLLDRPAAFNASTGNVSKRTEGERLTRELVPRTGTTTLGEVGSGLDGRRRRRLVAVGARARKQCE